MRYFAIALAVPVLLFFVLPPLGAAGIWDPFELRTAELARGIAEGAARGSLAQESIALGFRLFGLHDWAGRLPLAVWGLLGVLATFGFVARLVDGRAGMYAAIALATMPLYFVQARTMLGDIISMSALAMAFGGLAVVVFGGGGRVGRLCWLAVAALGIAAGCAARGAILGAALPLLAIGLSWGITRAAGKRTFEALGDVVASAALAGGVVAAALGMRAIDPAARPSFDVVLGHIGHALAPWSALVPFALGRLFASPPDCETSRASDVRVALLVGTALALFAHGWAFPDVAFTAPALLAAACAIALRDFGRGGSPSIAIGAGTGILLFVLYRDFKSLPEKTLEPFYLAGSAATVPEGFRAESAGSWALGLGLFACVSMFTWLERDSELRALFEWRRYRTVFRAIGGAWSGWALRIYAGAVVSGGAACFALFLGTRAHARWAAAVPGHVRDLTLGAWVLLALAPAATVVTFLVGADATAWLTRRVLRGHRGALLVAAGAATGFLLAFWQYPALARQLSPKAAFERYARVHHDGEPLAILGMTSRTAAYYAGREPLAFDAPEAALDWLMAKRDESGRRFLAVQDDALPRINALNRERTRASVPVLDGHSGRILLLASSLADGEGSENPLDAVLLSAPPAPQHPLRVDLAGELDALGYDLVTAAGAPAQSLVAGRRYRLRTYFRVKTRPKVVWQLFVHIEGPGRRHNADHALTDGKYPPPLWTDGDLVVDDHELSLPPNFTPGAYHVFYGLYVGETRLKIVSGASDGNDRIDGGELRVE